jgi:hypothetical protein
MENLEVSVCWCTVVDVLGDLLLLLWMMFFSCFKIDSNLTAIYLSIYLSIYTLTEGQT